MSAVEMTGPSAATAASVTPTVSVMSRGILTAESQTSLTHWVLIIAQSVFIILIGIFGDNSILPDNFFGGTGTTALDGYNFYLGVMVMMLVGFGYLMTFMKYYGLGAVGFCLLVTAIGLQWGLLCEAFFRMAYNNDWTRVPLDIYHIYLVVTNIAAPLISLGAVIGKVTPLQLVVMLLIEFVLHAINYEVFLAGCLKLSDIGGTYSDHMFGAYFGLAVAYVLGKPVSEPAGGHTSDLFSLVGTVFLWIYWPSFVAGFLESNSQQQQRALVNTILALCSSTVMAYLGSSVFGGGRFRTVDIQNATLAGGVTIGCLANLHLNPGVVLVIGGIAGLLSSYGFAVIQPLLCERYGLHDTCGVHNLHGMPSVLGGILSAFIALVTQQNGRIFYYTEGEQTVVQFFGVFVTVLFAIITGMITGRLLQFLELRFEKEEDRRQFTDHAWWEIGGDASEEGNAKAAHAAASSSSSAGGGAYAMANAYPSKDGHTVMTIDAVDEVTM